MIEVVAVGVAVAVAARVVLPGRLLVAVLAGAVAAGAASLAPREAVVADAALPGPSPRAGFATSGACAACHPGEHATWHASYHRTMTQVATTASVLAPFEGELSDRGVRLRLSSEAGDFRAHLLGPGGDVQRTRRVVMTTGSHHLQNYWLAEDDGWFTQLPFTWDIGARRWMPTQDSFLQPDAPEPQPIAVWNDSCVYCHTVGGAGGVSDDARTADTRVAELGVACEACHGPGAAHVAANRDPLRRYRAHFDDARDPTTAHPAKLPSDRANAVCGQCHGIFKRTDYPRLNQAGDAFTAGDALAPDRVLLLPVPHPVEPGRVLVPPVAQVAARVDGRAVEVLGFDDEGVYLRGEFTSGFAQVELGGLRLAGELRPHGGGATLEASPGWPQDAWFQLATALGWRGQMPTMFDLSAFWGDGTVRSTGREANGLAVTGCATRGPMTCGTCHSMHAYDGAADMLARDHEAVCSGCHATEAAQGAEHSHHADVACADCHMPHTTFGLLGAIRAHRVDSPTAAMSARHGRPNACNLCHLDRPLAWTAEWLERWYGQARPALQETSLSAAVGWMLAGDGAQRAVAAWAFRREPARRASGETWAAPLLAALLDDDYAAVRRVAGESLRALPGFDGWTYDALGPHSARRAAADDARRRWSAGTPDRTGPAVLVQGPGVFDLDAVQRLRAARDARPVVVSE